MKIFLFNYGKRLFLMRGVLTTKQKSIEEIFIECIKKTPDDIRMETFNCFSEELLSSPGSKINRIGVSKSDDN